jgi:hypothetical protein
MYSWGLPLNTANRFSRVQLLYLSSELGGAKRLTSLGLDATTLPRESLTNYTVRMKHTTLNNFITSFTWDASGWTVVYRTNQTLSSTGWVNFAFSTPFNYNGSNNLMIDFCLTNAFLTNAGFARSMLNSQYRILYYDTDSGSYGDPLSWSGSTPSPMPGTYLPNLRVLASTPVAIDLANSGAFTSGIWTGAVRMLETATNMSLTATDDSGHVGESNPFTVLAPPPAANLLTLRGPTGSAFGFAFASTPGATFTVLGTTNLALPLTNWSLLGPVTETPPGQFQFIDPASTDLPRRFYKLRWP